jgi:carbamoylphosphate synthase large subunit
LPRRTDIQTILVIGSGPIVIGQGCEFDYSGTQACKALRAEGYRVVLVNSNPATIMTDPEFSDRTYIEPVTPEAVRKVIEKQAAMGEPIDALLPTLGGQTALNVACALWDQGVLRGHGIEMIGADREAIRRAEDRQAFKEVCERIGLRLPESRTVTSLEQARAFLEQVGLPAIIRPAFTLGGTGGGIAYNREEFDEIVARGLRLSMIGQVQVDRSLLGWKEYELEVVRDRKDNCIVVCGIENIDPMGVHTGDSITVAPILTLTDKEYQAMRDAAFAIMRAVGVETGGSNVQFAVNPNPPPAAGPGEERPFEMVVVEMNPRVSRSSALASKATGFPIAKVAARLAVGYTLDELVNDITGSTSACFEPSIDYVVTKMPRWTFEKFPEADETLTTQMKSVGEAMAIGRTFVESLQKAIRSMEAKRFGLGLDRNDAWLMHRRGQVAPDGSSRTADNQPAEWPIPEEKLTRKLAVPSQGRLYYVRYAMKMGWDDERIASLTRIDPFFLDQVRRLVEFEDVLCGYQRLEDLPRDVLFQAKRLGYSDAQLANLYLGSITPETILAVRAFRRGLGVEPVYKLVDTCAAEFEARTPYYYSTYEAGVSTCRGAEGPGGERETATGPLTPGHPGTPPPAAADDEVRVSTRRKVVILGGGPNRIGQGIEFDYCCCHAAFAARDLGFESVMINSNPETVSTDYDTSDLLFFEPLTLEDVVNIVERLNGRPLRDHPTLIHDRLVNADGAFLSRAPIAGGRGAIYPLIEAAIAAQAIGPVALVGAHVERAYCDVFAVERRGRLWRFRLRPGEGPPEAEPASAQSAEAYLVPRWRERGAAALAEEPGLVHGVIVQFGGQTPLNLAHGLEKAGAPIIGTSVDSIDLAEDRKRFDALLERLGLAKPPSGTARTLDQAVEIAARIGYPVLVRPSYVLGGRGMEICADEKALRHYMTSAVNISELDHAPVLVDKFMDQATEVDVDVVADYIPGVAGSTASEGNDGTRRSIVCGVMEHIEQAGIHSGDSACAIPPWSLPDDMVERIRLIGRLLAAELRVNGLMNVQLAIKGETIYILEVNPRASRTAPFVGKATHVPWPRLAAEVMMGRRLVDLGAAEVGPTGAFAVKESVFPFSKFPGVDIVLGPEMRSTGEVMGIDASFEVAFAKSQMGAGIDLPTSGGVFVSVRRADRDAVIEPARILAAEGFALYATAGTAAALHRAGLACAEVPKIESRARPNVIDLMTDGTIGLVINTPTKTGWQTDEGKIRSTAVRLGVPIITTITGALAAVRAIRALRSHDWGVASMQEHRARAVARAQPPPPVPPRAPAPPPSPAPSLPAAPAGAPAGQS